LFGQRGDLVFGAAAANDPVGPKVVIGHVTFGHDVPVGDEDVVTDRADGFECSASGADGVIRAPR